MRKLFTSGIKKEIEQADIYEVLSSYESQKLGNQLERKWDNQRLKSSPSLFLLLWSCFGKQYMLIAVSQIIPIMITYSNVKYSNELLLVYVFCRIYRPRIVKNFVSYFTTNHNNFTKSQAWFLGVSFVTVQFIGFIYIDNFYLRLETFGVKIRTALTSLIYRKVLKLNLSQLENTTTGKIITLITRDVNEFDIYVFFATYLWCDSLRFLITCYVVYMEVGLLVLVLLVIFCIIISTQSKS
jgi:ATP-binding cassette subfamily C (CFTR/MRP) protein 4